MSTIFRRSAASLSSGVCWGACARSKKRRYQIKALKKQFPVEFHRGLIENLCSARIPDSAVDDVISNCAVNLVANKRGHAGK
jgi:hypothetical protein